MTDLSAYHARLPYGQRLSAEPVLGGPFFPFDGDVRVRPLDEPVVPEPPRIGAPGGAPCNLCAEPDTHLIWRDETWLLHAGFQPIGLPMLALLSTRRHLTLRSMPPDVAAGLGPVIQRIALAVERIEGVGRAHFSRWGDGGQHFHVWFLARPLGMMQLRRPMLAVWNDLLPKIPDDEFEANKRTVAAALAETGGRALV
ncbi:MAG TPA: hypothetical protein VGX25_23970 [Actinophytocola sp.]|uniref:hypothetical protein n=1 Tax=Actinophytocola sp. TaxID=1872138 RepID=UPI002DDD9023|nr:hypothetical protein [Actinophytocola sp.]HEV2782462.1 hypothetical protein [Actinophytocola sp.]